MSPRDRDEETGKFSQQYDPEEFLEAIETVETPTTAEISDWVGCSYNLAYRRLQDLEQEGKVVGTEIGGSFLWSAEN